MADMLQTAIDQQRNQYPGAPVGPFTGATISAAPPPASPLDPGYAYQYDIPRWLANTIYGAQLPLRGVAYASALPQELLHLVAKPETNMMFTGSPFDPGQVPSWWPKNLLQPRTDPVTNAMRQFAHGVDWVGETATAPFVTPEMLLMGHAMKTAYPEYAQPYPDPRDPRRIIKPAEAPAQPSPENIFKSYATHVAQIPRAQQIGREARELNQIERDARNIKRTFGTLPEGYWDRYEDILKKDPDLWKTGQKELRYRNYLRNKTILHDKLQREINAAAQYKRDYGALPKDYEQDLTRRVNEFETQWTGHPPERPSKFRSFVKPGDEWLHPGTPFHRGGSPMGKNLPEFVGPWPPRGYQRRYK